MNINQIVNNNVNNIYEPRMLVAVAAVVAIGLAHNIQQLAYLNVFAVVFVSCLRLFVNFSL